MADYYVDSFRDDADVSEVVSDSLAHVLNSFEEKLHENYLDTLQKGFTAKLMLEKINKMVSLAMLLPDGEFTAASEELEVFIPDGEPSPSTIDTWARGAVSTKKVAVADNTFRRAMPGASNTPSIASSHKSGRSKGTSVGTRSRLGTARSKMDDPLDATGKIIELDEELGDFAHLNSTGHMFDQLQKMKRNKAQGYVSKETSEKGEFEIIQDQLNRAEKEMKGKKFVLDRYGKPIALGKVNIETLPSLSDTPSLHVKDQQLETRPSYGEQSATAPLALDGQDTTGAPAASKKKIRITGHRSVEEGSFMPAITLASSLSGIDSIPKLNNGVSVKSINGTRSGQEIPDDPLRMSKKSYMRSQSSLFSNNSDSAGGGIRENSTISFSKSLGANNTRGGKSSTSMLSDGLNTNSMISAKSIEFLEDIDPYEGSKLIAFEPPSRRDQTDEELGLGVVTKPSPHGRIIGKVPKRRSQFEKDAQLVEITDSPINGKPRDRGLPKNNVPTSQHKHLPAPPPGDVTGHGLTYEKFLHVEPKTGDNDDWTSDWR